MLLEKLSSNNENEYKELLVLSKKYIDNKIDFYDEYNKSSILHKYLMRKLVKLIKIEGKIVGYIWLNSFAISKPLKINEIYIRNEYLNYIDENTLSLLKNSTIVYEAYENTYINNISNLMNMRTYKRIDLMMLENKYIECYIPKDISFRKCNIKTDRRLRCFIQNEIFKENGRVLLTESDIGYDEEQQYYIDDLCLFIKYKDAIIGYGQIIYKNGMYYLVNFGIIEKFRALGYGQIFLTKIINLTVKNKIEKIYIKVESKNIKAKTLYKKIGFTEIKKISYKIWNIR